MAPEVFMKANTEGHGRAADIWSIGCVILEMASGKVCIDMFLLLLLHCMLFMFVIIIKLIFFQMFP